jgi:class 3 adenylate cyclase
MKRFIDNYLNLGNLSTDSADVKRKNRIFIPMATSGVFVGLIVGFFEVSLDLYPQAYMPFLLSFLFALDLFLFWIFKNAAFSQYFAFLFLLVLPLIPQFILFVLALIITLLVEKYYPAPWRKVPEEISLWLLIFNFPGFIIFILANVSHFVRQKDKAMDALDKERALALMERQKSEKLLLNILPEKIANKLKQNEKHIADGFQSVSILFADIVGFTPLSSTLKPERLVSILNDLFSHFDQLAEKYKLEKIKTIGDAYMAAAGLPETDERHAIHCVQMALEMQKYMTTISIPETEKLELRIGIHSGPVVAGVIGIKKFSYDLWGDAVNTASRMESHGLPGEIQITASVKELIGDNFTLQERGFIEVKGKGLIEAYFVKEKLNQSLR